nr:MAG TPA: hypothetical protein [Caudoviricetes sp.]
MPKNPRFLNNHEKRTLHNCMKTSRTSSINKLCKGINHEISE